MVRTQGLGKGCTVKVYVSATSLPYLVVDMVCQVFLIAVHVPRCLRPAKIPKYLNILCTCMHTYHLIVYVRTYRTLDHRVSYMTTILVNGARVAVTFVMNSNHSLHKPIVLSLGCWVAIELHDLHILSLYRQTAIDDCWTEAFSTRTGSMETVC